MQVVPAASKIPEGTSSMWIRTGTRCASPTQLKVGFASARSRQLRWLNSGDLVWIMPEFTAQPMNIYALYSSREYLDAKIRTWVDFLREQLPEMLAAEQAALRQCARVQVNAQAK